MSHPHKKPLCRDIFDYSPTFSCERLEAGGNAPTVNTKSKTTKNADSCKGKKLPMGVRSYKSKPIVCNVVDLELNPMTFPIEISCKSYPLPIVPPAKTRGTQTLKRESSAQTLPYLATLKVTKCPEKLEICRLPSILPNVGVSGLNEVETLERERKRWVFLEALKVTFERDMMECRSGKKSFMSGSFTLHAFEWERWIEQEERLTQIQMQRFDLLLDMFDKREKEMHEKSKRRIEASFKQIEAKLQEDLRKSETRHARRLRHIEQKHNNIPRKWKKENITLSLGDPSSDYCAPQLRFGNNPSRRKYMLKSNTAFQQRMDLLTKQVRNADDLKCPFAKVNLLSQPKRAMHEVEQNFLQDSHLQNLYNELQELRQRSSTEKTLPKCLVLKTVEKKDVVDPLEKCRLPQPSLSELFIGSDTSFFDAKAYTIDTEKENAEKRQLFINQVEAENARLARLLVEKEQEEVEGLLSAQEGMTLGCAMEFLGEEMERLKEHRKIVLICMQLQLDRWNREAAEGGLRQKENEMREFYAAMWNEADTVNRKVCHEFLDDIMLHDVYRHAGNQSEEAIIALAKRIDDQIQLWLNALRSIQTTQDHDVLRLMLKNAVFPIARKVIKQHESKQVADYIINRVLFANIGLELQSYQISHDIANELVDRVIGNDLYIVSPDESLCNCGPECTCNLARREAHAILRKLVRAAAPERPYKTSTERICIDNTNDLIGETLEHMERRGMFDVKQTRLKSQKGHFDLSVPKEHHMISSSSSSIETAQEVVVTHMDDDQAIKSKGASRALRSEEKREASSSDSESDSPNSRMKYIRKYSLLEERDSDLGFLHHYWLKDVKSTVDIPSVADLTSLRQESFSSGSSENSVFIADSTYKNTVTQGFLNDLVKQLIRDLLTDAEIDYEHAGQPVASTHSLKTEDSFGSSSSTAEEEGEEEGEYELVVYESEIARMESDVCKCSTELEREAYIREMMKQGKVKIRRRVCLDVGDRTQRSRRVATEPSDYGLHLTPKCKPKTDSDNEILSSGEDILFIRSRFEDDSNMYKLSSGVETSSEFNVADFDDEPIVRVRFSEDLQFLENDGTITETTVKKFSEK